MATILVIEDEIVLLGLISSTLRQAGYSIIEANDTLTALGIVERGNQEIDLVLTDVAMTPMSGFGFATRLAQHRPDVPVLFMSGHHALTAAIADSLGQRSLLEKPFTAAELIKAVKKALTKSHRKAKSDDGKLSGAA